jgi:nitric oxide reductase subunit B
LAAVALVFWLMHRFSSITPVWADMSLYTVAGLLALAGALVTLTTLSPDSPLLGGASAIVIALLYLIFASHSYRALSDRNATNTLAAHWTALGVLLLLLGGVLGGLQAPVRLWTAGTRLSDLQPTLALLAVVAIILGVVNQAAAEMRGDNRRVTGLAPFWLVAFGVIGGGLALAGAGLVQVYLERILSIGYLDTQALLEPLHALWVGGQGLFALGVGWYTLVFWLRRPRL